jgi:hypothetical protein
MVAILKMQYLRCSAHVTECGRQVASVVDSQIGDTQCLISVFGHVDGVERTVGDPGVGGASASTALRSRFGDLTQRRRVAKFLGAV